MNDLSGIRNFIIDMDGVLWRGEQPLPGLVRFFEMLTGSGFGFCLATNNSTLTPKDYVAKLERFGVRRVSPLQVVTSATASAEYLRSMAPAGARVAALGEPALDTALTRAGLTLDAENPEYLVVGMDRALTWEKLAQAALHIQRGAIWIGTNPDSNVPSERGNVPETGAILAALQAATGKTPLIIGKPEPVMYQMAMRHLGAPLSGTAAIGDRLDTDILGAHRTGIASILLLTGVATADQAAASEHPPDRIFPDLPALIDALEAVR